MNCRALERGDLGASFEPYSNLVRGVVASLSLKMYDLFFYKVVPLSNALHCQAMIAYDILSFNLHALNAELGPNFFAETSSDTKA